VLNLQAVRALARACEGWGAGLPPHPRWGAGLPPHPRSILVLNLQAGRRPALWVRPPDCRPKVPQAGEGSAAGGPGVRHPVSLGLILMSVDPRSHGYILGLSGLECDLNHWAGPP
jgi:hypothetical protein